MRAGSWMWILVVGWGACTGGAPEDPPPPPPSTPEACGDGLVQGDEECDDGPQNGDDRSCTSTCALAVCGDGLVWAGQEDCDEGAANADGGACTTACAVAVCGDGLLWPDGGEQCDDGDANADDASCTASCQHAFCGDGLVFGDAGEECDEGAANSDDGACTSACVLAVCGDGLLFDDPLGEDCDDGNATAYDGCSPQCTAPRAIDLPLADGTLLGENSDDLAAESVAGVGDVNGDGLDDLLIGAPDHDGSTPNSGAAYLVYGPATGNLTLADADVKLTGEAWGDRAGVSVAGAGDVNGDGFADLIVGANRDDEGGTDAGAAYVVYGPVAGDLDLANADAKLVGGWAGGEAGTSVAGAGDIDADGFDDLIVGAPHDGEAGRLAGAAYIVYGPVAGTVDLATQAKLLGVSGSDQAGSSVCAAGDVDGDGIGDVVVGAPQDDTADRLAGAAYLVHGPILGVVSLANADASMYGNWLDAAGTSACGVGDLDGDGFADLAIGSPGSEAAGLGAGAVHVIHGPIVGDLVLDQADATLVGKEYRFVGGAVAPAGDVDGDGLDDLLVGAGGSGEGYLLYGPLVGEIDLHFADVTFVGEHFTDAAGRALSGAGDLDGDGRLDLVIGAPRNDLAGDDAGAAYVLLGPL